MNPERDNPKPEQAQPAEHTDPPQPGRSLTIEEIVEYAKSRGIPMCPPDDSVYRQGATIFFTGPRRTEHAELDSDDENASL